MFGSPFHAAYFSIKAVESKGCLMLKTSKDGLKFCPWSLVAMQRFGTTS